MRQVSGKDFVPQDEQIEQIQRTGLAFKTIRELN